MHSGSLPSRTDEELVRLALDGNMRAYNTLVYRFRGAVVLVAEQIVHSHEVAEDVAQEVFLVAAKSLPRLRDPKRFASWLYAITRYRAHRARKQAQRTLPMEPELLHVVVAQLSAQEAAHPEKALLLGEYRNELTAALATLKPELRLVLLLRYKEAWPVARICEFFALPLTTIQGRLHQARKQLKQQLLAPQKEFEHE